jgi:hypothetical protein
MVRRYLRSLRPQSWGLPTWRWRTHHVLGAGFLASALGFYPAAASMGVVPSLSTAYSWLTTNAPTIESEVESAAKDPTEYSKTLPGKLVSAVETLGAQAAAANGIALNPPNTTAPSFGPAKTGFAASGKSPGGFAGANALPSVAPTGGYQPAGYAGAYPNGYPPNGYPPPGYPMGGYPAGYQNNYTTAYNSSGYAVGDIACYFSPAGGCTEACVNEIRQAQQQILVQAYSFTSVPIANALVEAHNRGVAIYIVLDKSQKSEQYSSADFVAHAGIATLIDSKHAIAHNKIMLIDRQTIITGSFNFTTSAEKSNAENLLVIRNRPDLYQAYENNFRHHYEHSEPYQGRGNATQPTQPHSHMPTTNSYGPGPSGYQQAGGYQQPSGYQQNPGYPQAGGYQQPAGYPSPNPYNYGGNSYPQTASPVYPSGGYRY